MLSGCYQGLVAIILYVTGFAKTQHNDARTEIHFIA